MTGGEVLAWLESRRPAPPAALLAPLEAAVTDRAAALPDHLSAVGRELLARVAASPRAGRELALDLLASRSFDAAGKRPLDKPGHHACVAELNRGYR